MKYQINGKLFAKKSDIKTHFSAILNRANLGENLSEPDLGDCIGLFGMHPESEQKFGPGIDSVRVVIGNFYRNRGFVIERVDGSRCDISYLKCISGRKNTGRKNFTTAARIAIVGQILDFKDESFSGGFLCKCSETGKMISKSDCDVDHVIPFSQILGWFVDRRTVDIDSLKYRHLNDGVIEFEDEAIAADWRDFHASHAKLQIVCKQAHKEVERNRRLNSND